MRKKSFNKIFETEKLLNKKPTAKFQTVSISTGKINGISLNYYDK